MQSNLPAVNIERESETLLVKTLDDIDLEDATCVGGKALNCARLRQAGFPVPDGIVLTTHAMNATLALPALQRWLANQPQDALLAVRSSATDEDSAGFSFAGIHETRLNVPVAQVDDAVHVCWSSVTTQQAMAYRKAQNLSTRHPRTAVLIQRMVKPVAAGVAFTLNPVTGNGTEFVINSIFGLGEALVSGQVEPDEFRVQKATGQILSSRIAGPTPSLTTTELNELTALLARIERHFGNAQDVEWCHDGSQFWIVQSRPITRTGDARNFLWTRANAREVLPDLPSPLTIYPLAETVEESQRRFAGKLLAPESELGRFAKVFNGRLYYNVDQLRFTCRMSGTPPAVILRSLGHEGPIEPADEVAARASPREALTVLPDLIRLMWGQIRVKSRVRQQQKRTVRLCQQLSAVDYTTQCDRDLWVHVSDWIPQMIDELQIVFLLTGVSVYEQSLLSICAKTGYAYERLAYTSLAAGEKSVSSAQAFDLIRLARVARAEAKSRSYFASRELRGDYREALQGTEFLAQFDRFLETYGHRGHYESDVAFPRYREDPSPLLSAIQAHVAAPDVPDPDQTVARQNAEAAEVWKEFELRLKWWQKPVLAPVARWLLGRIKQFYLWRESCRSNLVLMTWPIRVLHLELAGRFVQRGWIESRDDYFYLTPEEIGAACHNPLHGPTLAATLSKRKEEWTRLAAINMPLLMRDSEFALVGSHDVRVEDSAVDAHELKGLCVSPGCVEGEVIVLHSPSEFARMKRGAILVTTATDPSWTPLFTLASGVIVEVGGILSHASTVAREYGLPALANLKHATKIFSDGQRVRLDATNGVVNFL